MNLCEFEKLGLFAYFDFMPNLIPKLKCSSIFIKIDKNE